MSDDPTPNADEPKGKAEFTPITSQDELNAALKDRLARERAKFSDYADLKAKADRLDAIEAANKTEAEKAAERIAQLERDLSATQSTALRARIQARFQIEDEDADLFLTATDEDTLTKQAERLAARAADRKNTGGKAPLQGRPPTNSATDSDERAFVRELFKATD